MSLDAGGLAHAVAETRRNGSVTAAIRGAVPLKSAVRKSPRTNRAGYKTNSFGIHLEKDCTKRYVVAMGKKHGFRLPDSFRADGRPNCYVILERGKNLPAVLKAVLLNEPKVVSVNLNYFET